MRLLADVPGQIRIVAGHGVGRAEQPGGQHDLVVRRGGLHLATQIGRRGDGQGQGLCAAFATERSGRLQSNGGDEAMDGRVGVSCGRDQRAHGLDQECVESRPTGRYLPCMKRIPVRGGQSGSFGAHGGQDVAHGAGVCRSGAKRSCSGGGGGTLAHDGSARPPVSTMRSTRCRTATAPRPSMRAWWTNRATADRSPPKGRETNRASGPPSSGSGWSSWAASSEDSDAPVPIGVVTGMGPAASTRSG